MKELLITLLAAYLGGVAWHASILSCVPFYQRGITSYWDMFLWPFARPVLATAVFSAAVIIWRIYA